MGARWASIVVAALAAVACLGPARAAPLPDLGGRTVRAVTENAFPPLNFADPATGRGIGFEYDLVDEIGRRLDAKIEWHLSSWDAMIQAVRDGQFDVGMDGITIRDDRRAQVDFSAPYMRSEMFLMVRAGETRFGDAAGFKADPKALVGAQAGTTNFYVAVSDLLGGDENSPRIRLFETFGASMQALKAGDVDAVLSDRTAGEGYVAAYPNTYKIVGGGMGAEDYGLIFKPGSDLRAPFDAALKAMQDDGTVGRLTVKWYRDHKTAP